jgi:hypothetical protein
MGETQHFEDVHAAVHAGDHRQLSPRMDGQVVVVERLDVAGVVGKQFVGAWFEGRITDFGHDRTVAGP